MDRSSDRIFDEARLEAELLDRRRDLPGEIAAQCGATAIVLALGAAGHAPREVGEERP